MAAAPVGDVRHDDVRTDLLDLSGDDVLQIDRIQRFETPIGKIEHFEAGKVEHVRHLLHLRYTRAAHFVEAVPELLALARRLATREREKVYLVARTPLPRNSRSGPEGFVVGMRKYVEDPTHGTRATRGCRVEFTSARRRQ